MGAVKAMAQARAEALGLGSDLTEDVLAALQDDQDMVDGLMDDADLNREDAEAVGVELADKARRRLAVVAAVGVELADEARRRLAAASAVVDKVLAAREAMTAPRPQLTVQDRTVLSREEGRLAVAERDAYVAGRRFGDIRRRWRRVTLAMRP